MKNTTKITMANINDLTAAATLSTLKRIYSASGEQRIYTLCTSLINDLQNLKNSKNDTISDGYDLYICAYEAFLKNVNRPLDAMIPVTLKSGNVKTYTVIQYVCRVVRHEVYKHHSIENKSNCFYIDDFSQLDEDGNIEPTEATVDRLMLKAGRYEDVQTYEDFTAYNDFLNDFKSFLNDRQLLILHHRLQGLSTAKIAEKLNVSQQAISKHLAKIQSIIIKRHPEKVRLFKKKRIK